MPQKFLPLLLKSRLGSLAVIGAASSTLILTACNKPSNTQSIQVPPSVQSAFAAKYPGVSPTWASQAYGYEAIFPKNGIEYEAEFSKDGRWLETEYEVPENQFSTLVLNRVKKEYPGYKIKKREIELTPRGTFYEVEVEGGGKQIERYYDERGNPARNSNEDA
jgi:Putative beta-lactamase-inhibitor-like, PepSY-like